MPFAILYNGHMICVTNVQYACIYVEWDFGGGLHIHINLRIYCVGFMYWCIVEESKRMGYVCNTCVIVIRE